MDDQCASIIKLGSRRFSGINRGLGGYLNNDGNKTDKDNFLAVPHPTKIINVFSFH